MARVIKLLSQMAQALTSCGFRQWSKMATARDWGGGRLGNCRADVQNSVRLNESRGLWV